MAEPAPTTELIEALQGVLRQVAEPSHVLRIILEQAVSRTGAERGLFVEVDESGGLDYQVLHGFAARQLEGDAGAFSRSLFARVIETGREVRLASVTDDPSLAGVESVRELRTAAILCLPIRTRHGIAALVHLEHPNRGHFTESHQQGVRALLDIATPVFETLRASRQVIGERDRLRASETRLRTEAEESRRQLASDWSFGRFVGRSPAVRALETTVRQVAETSFPVLLLGETGTGKSIVARAIHYAGPRAAQPLITVFCPSLERGMVEAELFGHRRGAFTGATADRIGKVQAADRGTLFLDEIGELPLEIQPKLLRLLQEQTFEPIGDARERRVDLRIIAATHRDLEREVEQGRFRRDLFERLNYVPVRVPPLRERVEDIPLLLRHALDQTEAGRWIELSPEAERLLVELDFTWPGNVRHVEQLAARLTVGAVTSPVSAEVLLARLGRTGAEAEDGASRAEPAPARDSASSRRASPAAALESISSEAVPSASPVAGADLSPGLPSLLADAERSWLQHALRVYPDLTRAELAERLKVSESTLYKKLRQHGLG